MQTPQYPERPARVTANQPCTIARSDGSSSPGTLLNLSYGGFCVGAKSSPLEGEHIEMRILGLGRLKGTVRWVRRGRAGGVLNV